MAYKKYIKKGGKLYGPYIYHSRREDGKVVSEYRGLGGGRYDINSKKILIAILGIFLLTAMIYLSINIGKNLTGKAILDLDADYSGEILKGKLVLSSSGDIPENARLVFESNNETIFEGSMEEFISPEISFNLLISSGQAPDSSSSGQDDTKTPEQIPSNNSENIPQDNTEDTPTNNTGNSNNQETPIETEDTNPEQEIVEEKGETGSVPENTIDENDSEEIANNPPANNENPEKKSNSNSDSNEKSAPENQGKEEKSDKEDSSTSNSDKKDSSKESSDKGSSNKEKENGGSPLTGGVISHEVKTVGGRVSKGNFFIYTLGEDESFEGIEPGSVKTDEKEINDKNIQAKTKGKEINVSTDYIEEDIIIDLSKFNMPVKYGILKISVKSEDGSEIASLSVNVDDSEIIDDSLNESSTNLSEVLKIEESIKLTPEEEKILLDEFGTISIKTKSATEKNGFLTLNYEIGKYSIDFSYDSKLSDDTLKYFSERDRAEWLKDIAKSLQKKQIRETPIKGFNESYNF